ncbi:hypothetical protein KOW79_009428 [Hemibagrus wyckioides]|uniref:Uncharacterized protein n=2 Tax=Hemibagrus wyckioides TaxID=337641 RepID=A0A9D3NT42_9TELE|nr:hypothetical protein KOW79_009428 [Hemibagrus wyckioides]
MNEKKRRSQSGRAGVSTLSTTSDHRPKCFRDIMELVLHLSDEEWTAVSRGMTKKLTRLEFASVCSKIVTEVSSAVVRRLLKPLSRSFGMEAILEASDKLKEMAESKSSKCSASDASAQRSPMEVSDFICHLGQRVVTEVKGAMLEAIRSTASAPSPSTPAEDPILQLHELSTACTNEICDKILFHTKELQRSGGASTSVLSLLMKSLEKAVSVSRSSSWITVSSTSDLVSTTTEVTSSDYISSIPQSMSLFSDEFFSIVPQVISEVLLKMNQKLSSSSVSSQSSFTASNDTEMDLLIELARNTALEILQKFMCVVVDCSDADQSGTEGQQILSFAQRIHADIHKAVFSFISKRKQAVPKKSKTLLDVCTETDAELDVGRENAWKSVAAAEQLLDKATQVASDILVNRLNSQISTGLISAKGLASCTAASSTASVDLDRVASGSTNERFSGVPLQIGTSAMVNGSEAWVSEAQVGDADVHSAPDSRSPSNIQSLSGLEESVLDAERKPSDQNSPYVPLHLFTVVRNQLKAFFTFFSKCAADDQSTEVSAHSESNEDHVTPIHISGDGSVHELGIGRSLSDSVLLRRNSMLRSMRFPSELIYRFVDESVKGLLRNVLNNRSSDGSYGIDGTNGSDGHSSEAAEVQEKKKRPRVRYVLKTSRHVVVKRPRKQKKKQLRVPLPHGEQPSTPVTADLHDASHRGLKTSRSIFKNARRTLGRFFSNISKTFTSCFSSPTAVSE